MRGAPSSRATHPIRPPCVLLCGLGLQKGLHIMRPRRGDGVPAFIATPDCSLEGRKHAPCQP
eukprot:13852682-Alexandrium_andersonii.AAC.1